MITTYKLSIVAVLLWIATTGRIAIAGDSDNCSTLIERAPRGITCLHCMQPEANKGVQPLIDTIKATCLKNVATSFLTDGSFGFNGDVIKNVVTQLSSNGRHLSLHLYVVNGPGQRRWKSASFKGFAIMNPVVFRSLIKTNVSLQLRYTSVVKRLIPIIQYAQSKGAAVSLTPALEDNLDNAGFVKILELTKKALSSVKNISFIRSPCGDCFGGNQTGTPSGVRREVHTLQATFSVQNSIISNDGLSFRFQTDLANKGGPPLSTLLASQTRAQELRSVYLLWVDTYQGSQDFYSTTPVEKRRFAIPTNSERQEISKFLTQ